MSISILNRENLMSLLTMEEVIEAVKEVYCLKSQGKTAVWPHIIYDFDDPKGVIDLKAGFVSGDVMLHGAKLLNTFNGNVDHPIFNGLMMIFDSRYGIPIGIMDASYVTGMRTGAAGALGVKLFAREDSKNLFILGAGRQAVFQLAATLILMPQLEKIYIGDPISYENACAFSKSIPTTLLEQFGVDASSVNFVPVEDMASAVSDSDVVITITPSREPVIQRSWLKEGTHLSCVGADMHGKEEIAPDCFVGATIFADDVKQCANVGEMEIPLRDGVIKIEDVSGEIGDVLNGTLKGRTSPTETTIFDATGLYLLDIATAKIALDKAKEQGGFMEFTL